MTVVSTLDVHGLTAQEYRAVTDELGVETRPESGIYVHLTTPIELGFRVVEIWNEKEGFDRFVEHRLAPAGEAVGLNREMTIAVTPLHNFFAPCLTDSRQSWRRSRRVSAGVRSSVWVVHFDGSGLREIRLQAQPACGGPISDPASRGCIHPRWSPDGKQIIFSI